jgi:ABC-2 type transport system ATP-binding protein
VKDLLQDLVQNGVTVVLSTHILEIAERLADRIGILHRGRLRAEGDLDQLRAMASGRQSLEDVFLALTGDGGATVA